VARNRAHARLARSESAALPGPHEHVSALIRPRQDRGDDAARLDALDELDRQRCAGSHVRVDDQCVQVNVLEDPLVVVMFSMMLMASLSPSTDFLPVRQETR
jgi:hypothetical protein